MKVRFLVFFLLVNSLHAMQERQISDSKSLYNSIVYSQLTDKTGLSIGALEDSLVYADGEIGFTKWQHALLSFLEVKFVESLKSNQISAYNFVHRWRLATSNQKVRRNLKQFGATERLINSVSVALKSYNDKNLEEIAERIRRPVILDVIDE